MKPNYAAALSFLLLLGLVYFSFYTHKPQSVSDAETPLTQFSTARAMVYVDSISREAHAVGMPAHQSVQDYIVHTLEAMNLEVEIQSDFAYKPGWGALSRAENIRFVEDPPSMVSKGFPERCLTIPGHARQVEEI